MLKRQNSIVAKSVRDSVTSLFENKPNVMQCVNCLLEQPVSCSTNSPL